MKPVFLVWRGGLVQQLQKAYHKRLTVTTWLLGPWDYKSGGIEDRLRVLVCSSPSFCSFEQVVECERAKQNE